jgi:hypothetical protein
MLRRVPQVLLPRPVQRLQGLLLQGQSMQGFLREGLQQKVPDA